MNQLLYITYGKTEIIYECLYSIFSLLKVDPDFYLNHKIVVYTDKPKLFDIIPEKYIEVRVVSDDVIKDYRGEYDFVFRPKVKMLIDSQKDFQGKTLFCDADIYYLSSPKTLFQNIDDDNYLMCSYEEIIGSYKHNVSRRYMKFINKNEKYLAQNNIFIKPDTPMWNSGVLGFSSKNATVFDDVLKFTDAICCKFISHITEQLASSYYFNKKNIKTTEDIIFHYWDFKEFRQILKAFFEYHNDKKSSFEHILKNIDNIRPDRLMQPKMEYQKLSFFPKALRKLRGKKNRWKLPDYSFD